MRRELHHWKGKRIVKCLQTVVDAQHGPHSCQTVEGVSCSFYKPLQNRIPFIR